ncbi:MAG: hypothetical protein LBD15_01505 [Holosporales bacterium]|jgi:hypothetical protein|nr:hypothetical protein [Holosporales bacterium]
MKKRFVRTIVNLAVAIAMVFCSVMTKGNAMRGISVYSDTEETESGKRPIFRKVGTDEKVTKEDYLKRIGGSSILPLTQEELGKRYNQFKEVEDVRVLIDRVDRGYFRMESFLMYEVVFSCFEGTSPAYLLQMFRDYVTCLLEHSDKSFIFFSRRGFDQSFSGAFNMLIRSRDACGLKSKDLFLDVLAEGFDGICSSGHGQTFVSRLGTK